MRAKQARRAERARRSPPKADLAAAEEMLRRATDEIRALAASVRSANMTIDDFVHRLEYPI